MNIKLAGKNTAGKNSQQSRIGSFRPSLVSVRFSTSNIGGPVSDVNYKTAEKKF